MENRYSQEATFAQQQETDHTSAEQYGVERGTHTQAVVLGDEIAVFPQFNATAVREGADQLHEARHQEP